MNTNTKKLKFNLLENAMDSLHQGVGFLLKADSSSSSFDRAEPSQSDLKLAVMLIAQAVELLLKERLRREDESLVFTTHPPQTVNIKEAIKKLKTRANVTLLNAENKIIINLSKVRNDIQHYKIEISYPDVLSKTDRAIGFITRFLHDELGIIDIRDYLKQSDSESILFISDVAKSLREICNKRINALKNEFDFSNSGDASPFQVLGCSVCLENFYVFVPSENISQCFFCKNETGVKECANCGKKGPGHYWWVQSDDNGDPLCDDCWETLGYKAEQELLDSIPQSDYSDNLLTDE